MQIRLCVCAAAGRRARRRRASRGLALLTCFPATPLQLAATPSINQPPLQDLREKLGGHSKEAKKVAKALLDVQQRIPQARRPACALLLGFACVRLPRSVPAPLRATQLTAPPLHPSLQVTTELKKLEATRASTADGSSPLRAELRRLEAAGAEAQKRAAAKQALLATIERELAGLQVGWGWLVEKPVLRRA